MLFGRLNSEKACKPILLGLNVSLRNIALPCAVVRRSRGMTEHTDRLGAGTLVEIDIYVTVSLASFVSTREPSYLLRKASDSRFPCLSCARKRD